LGTNLRLMINFSCRKRSKARVYPFVNIIFLVDTGSPNSYLCTEAMQAILGKDRQVELYWQLISVKTNTLIFIYHLPMNIIRT
jgi:hypothetical protein